MSKPRAKIRLVESAKKKPPALAAFARRDRWLLGAMTALFVGRPLLASEGVAWLGDGLPWVMLWFVLATVVCLLALRRGRLATPLAWLDGLVILLVLWHTLAAVVALRTGSPRPAVNMLWEWAGLGLSFFCARQLIRGQDEARGVAAMMIALAVGLSTLGYEQFFVQMPDARADYKQDPDAMLKSAGWDYAAGSPERKLFQDRLESTEPVATFALTNSFAGLLVPWLVVAVGVLAGTTGAALENRSCRGLFGRVGVVAGVIFGCLLLTKCRSGWIGFAVACAGLTAIGWHARGIVSRGRLWPAAGVVGAVVMIAALARGLDRELLTEAKKSLGFRLEYWQASWAMIRDNPWFGCGPGNFQDSYTFYKLPAASEEIRDPHNFVVELAATAGIPAALAMLGVLGVFFLQIWRALRSGGAVVAAGMSSNEVKRHAAASALLDKPAVAPGATIRAIAVGGACGLLVAEVIGWIDIVPLGLQRLAIIGGGGVTAWLLLRPWTLWDRLRPGWLAMAVLGQSVHHLAAGGIGFPGVSESLWLLLAMGSRLIEAEAVQPMALQPAAATGSSSDSAADASSRSAAPRAAAWRRYEPIGLLTAIVCGAFGCFVTGYRPVLERNSLMQQAGELDIFDAHHEARRRDILLQASRADSLSDEPPRVLAEQCGTSLLNRSSDENKRQFDNAVDVMLRLRPRSSSVWLEAAQWYGELYQHRRNPPDAERAELCAAEAVRLYPNSAKTRAAAADIHASADHPELAARAAREACRLDAITPHLDKKLTSNMRLRMQTLAEAAPKK